MTMALCYVELEGHATIQWIPVVINLFVHVIMYYYYALSSVSSKPIWWKKYLTTLQITQFVIDMFAVYFGLWIVASTTSDSLFVYVRSFSALDRFWYVSPDECYATPTAAYFGCFILTSYLVLFIQFFYKTYKKPEDAAKNQKGVKVVVSSTRKSPRRSPRKLD